MDVRYIYKLEKHYHRVLSEILFSNEVISSIKKLEIVMAFKYALKKNDTRIKKSWGRCG